MEQHPDSPAVATAHSAAPDSTPEASPDPGPAAEPSPPIAAADTDGAPPPNGYDPAEYRWVPVRRRARYDGWTEEKMRRFIDTLVDAGQVRRAALCRSAFAASRRLRGRTPAKPCATRATRAIRATTCSAAATAAPSCGSIATACSLPASQRLAPIPTRTMPAPSAPKKKPASPSPPALSTQAGAAPS